MSIFSKVQLTAPDYNWFDLSHDFKSTFPLQRLVPVWFTMANAGERFKVNAQHLLKFFPLSAPVYQRFDVRLDSFAYPVRLLYSKIGDFLKGGASGNKDFSFPTIKFYDLLAIYYNASRIYTFTKSLGIQNNRLTRYDSKGLGDSSASLLGTLSDFMGLPTLDEVLDTSGTVNDFLVSLQKIFTDEQYIPLLNTDISLLPFLAYQGLYRQYYRQQFVEENLYDEDIPIEDTDPHTWVSYMPDIDAVELINMLTILNPDFGVEVTSDTTSISNNSRFTLSDLSSDEFGRYACIVLNLFGMHNAGFVQDYLTSAMPSPQMGNQTVQIPLDLYASTPVEGGSPSLRKVSFRGGNNNIEYNGTVMSATTSKAYPYNNATIPDFRKANLLQEYLERAQLAGNRFIEWVKNVFGVQSSDARYHLPQFLGRTKSLVNISEVNQTSSSVEDSPLGDFAGHGTSVNGDYLFDFTCEEPTYLMVILSVVPRQSYYQGIDKHWTKTDRFDYLIPQFAKIGMQSISVREVNALDTSTISENNYGIFGYADRYAEYKFEKDRIAGDFKDSLIYWHDSRVLGGFNKINADFIHSSPHSNALNRIFNYTDTDFDPILGAIYFNIQAERPLPVYPDYRL